MAQNGSVGSNWDFSVNLFMFTKNNKRSSFFVFVEIKVFEFYAVVFIFSGNSVKWQLQPKKPLFFSKILYGF